MNKTKELQNQIHLDYNKGAGSLYFQIKQLLLQSIKDGKYKKGELIPSEMELGDLYNVSRTTIRLAINELVQEGYLIRQRGKGTTVKQSKIVENIRGIKSFTNEMSEKGFIPTTKKVIVSVERANEEISNALDIAIGSSVYCIFRVRCVDDEPLVVFVTYLPGKLEMSISENAYLGSLYEYLSNNKGIQLVRILEHIEVGYPTPNICSELLIPSGSAVLLRTRTSFDEDNNPVEFTKSYYRADKYTYSLEFKK